MEVYLAVKKNENKSFAGKWVEFMITVSEISQIERGKNIVFSFMFKNMFNYR